MRFAGTEYILRLFCGTLREFRNIICCRKNTGWLIRGMYFLFAFGLVLVSLHSCKVYSFTGANIPPDIKTFSVELFQITANNGPAIYPQQFTDRLKLKFQTEANLRMVARDGDLQFKGTITEFSYTSEAPVAGATSGLNKLTVRVQVEFINTKNEKDNFNKAYTRFVQFPAGENIPQIESRLLDEINRQLVDDIFQDALVKW
ncbi:MAG: LPS assembly lipoprotein LptE [Chitinophagales bacterium]|nr:LPS assembly lipoprotein LptE [Chitinophagales bacterium]MDW8418353.1 LPS assembly lipoprotein LptE [Chitinophagales bacterium]